MEGTTQIANTVVNIVDLFLLVHLAPPAEEEKTIDVAWLGAAAAGSEAVSSANFQFQPVCIRPTSCPSPATAQPNNRCSRSMICILL